MHPELQENGKLAWPPFCDPSASRWHHARWEDLDPIDRADVWEALNEALALFPKTIDDVELCGSRAFGNAHDRSDFDFNLVTTPMSPDYQQSEWWWDFTNKINEISQRLGVRIEAAPTVPSQRETNVIFSLREYRFYGKEWGETISSRRRWSKDQKTWVVAPLRQRGN